MSENRYLGSEPGNSGMTEKEKALVALKKNEIANNLAQHKEEERVLDGEFIPKGSHEIVRQSSKQLEDVLDEPVVSRGGLSPYAGVPNQVKGSNELARKKPSIGERVAKIPEDPKNPGTLQKKFRVGIVDTSDQIEKMARDAADRNLTASKEELKGFKGFLKKMWKHNMFHEYYRQKEIAKAKTKIRESGNAFANEGDASMTVHEEAQRAVTERFIRAFEEENADQDFLHAGEQGKKLGNDAQDGDLKRNLKDLVLNYAQGSLDDKTFADQKERLFSGLHDSSDSPVSKNKMYADNMLDIAKQVRAAVAHGTGIEQLDIDFDVVIGKAKTGVRTEAQFGAVDRITDKIQKSFVGRFANETTIALGVAAAYSAGSYVSQRLASSKLAAWGTFGASALMGGGIAAARESRRLEMERAQHAREAAQGRTFEPGSVRRAEMEVSRHETRSVEQLTEALNASLYEKDDKGGMRLRRDLDEAGLRSAVAQLAEIESRIQISDTNKIDLIGYSGSANVERQRLDLDVTRAKAKVDLRRSFQEKGINLGEGQNVNSLISNFTQGRMQELLTGDKGVEERNRIFQKMKRSKMAKKAVTAVAVGIAIGASVREVTALFDDGRQGYVEQLYEHIKGGSKLPPDDGILRAVGDHSPATGQGAEMTGSKAPTEGVAGIHQGLSQMEQMQRGYSGDLISKLQEQQGVSDHTADAYSRGGGSAVETIVTKHVSPHDFVDGNDHTHSVHRQTWMDNNTSRSDRNEVNLHMGGKYGSGVDKDGNFVYNIKEMTAHGSKNGNAHIDVPKMLQEGKLKMIFSLSQDTQNRVFEVPIDSKGNAIIPPDSEIGKLFFAKDGQGNMKFLGKFAEVAQVTGEKDGVEQLRIFATAKGPGIGDVEVETKVPRIVETPSPVEPVAPPAARVEVPQHFGEMKPQEDPDVPPIIPILSRRPLEPSMVRKMEKDVRNGYANAYEAFGYGGFMEQSEYAQRASKRIQNDPDYDVIGNDGALAAEYLAKQDPEYMRELEKMIESSGPMKQSIDVSVIMPAYHEAKNLEKTLEQYAKMKSKDRFELMIFENHPKDKERDNTAEIIRQAKEKYPDLNIVHMYKMFDEKPNIGELRKYIVDASLLRKGMGGIDKSTVFVSNDADTADVSPEYINFILEDFSQNGVDAVSGKMDFPKDAFQKMPLFHASQRLWDYFRIVSRYAYGNRPELCGANSAFRSGIYSAIGGYNKRSHLAEDLEVGWMIKAARKEKSGRIRYDNRMSLVTSARRPVIKLLQGGSLADQYEDFHKNETVRRLPVDEMLDEGHDMDWNHFEEEVQRMYTFYDQKRESKGGWMADDVMEKTFKRAMYLLGVDYRLEGDKVVLLDTSRLEASLKKAQS